MLSCSEKLGEVGNSQSQVGKDKFYSLRSALGKPLHPDLNWNSHITHWSFIELQTHMLLCSCLKKFSGIMLVWQNKLLQSSLLSFHFLMQVFVFFCFALFFTSSCKLLVRWNTWLWKRQVNNFFVIGLRGKKEKKKIKKITESQDSFCFKGSFFPVVQVVFLQALFLFRKSRRGQQKPAAGVKLHFKTLSFLAKDSSFLWKIFFPLATLYITPLTL